MIRGVYHVALYTGREQRRDNTPRESVSNSTDARKRQYLSVR